jgi:hypothetical protein
MLRPRLKLLRGPLHRGRETELVQNARPELCREPADHLNRVIRQFQDRLRSFHRVMLMRRQLVHQRRHVDRDAGQRLTEFIVNLTRHSRPFFLADILQPRRKRPQLIERTLEDRSLLVAPVCGGGENRWKEGEQSRRLVVPRRHGQAERQHAGVVHRPDADGLWRRKHSVERGAYTASRFPPESIGPASKRS